MKKLGFYGAVVAVLVFMLWFATKDGMQQDERYSLPLDEVGSIILQSRSFDKRVRVEDREDIGKLTGELSKLTDENSVWIDREDTFPERMENWKIEWLSPQGESLVLVEINSRGRVFRGDQCFNFLGGDIFDMDYLTGLLLGLPGEELEPLATSQPTPEPTPIPTPAPEPTPAFETIEDPPEELVFDFTDAGHILMMNHNGGKNTAIKGEELEAFAQGLAGLRFELREAYTIEALAMHAQEEDKKRYHGNPAYDLICFDKDGHKLETFTVRRMDGWINYYGFYYQAAEGGVDLERLDRLDKEAPQAEYIENFPLYTVKEDISQAQSVVISDREETWAVLVSDPELVERIRENVQGMEFKGQAPEGEVGMDYYDACTYELTWYPDRLGPYSEFWLCFMLVIDSQTVNNGGDHYKALEGSIDMELLDELAKPDGKYSARDGVRVIKEKPEE